MKYMCFFNVLHHNTVPKKNTAQLNQQSAEGYLNLN